MIGLPVVKPAARHGKIEHWKEQSGIHNMACT
jgi:hypothetical protein